MNDLVLPPPVEPAALPLTATLLLDEPSSAFDHLDPAERSDLLGRAYDEFCDLTEAGRAVDPDEFCARFPAFRTSLAKLLQCHRELEEHPELCEQIDVRWPEPGESFLGFGLRRELGRGTFARAYLAEERAVGDRLVALKVSAHKDAEAHTLGRLRHPNVVPIYSTQYDVGSGLTYVCMPYLGGTTLGDMLDYFGALKRRPRDGREMLEAARDGSWPSENAVPPPEAFARGSHLDAVLHIVERLADALAFVHSRSLLHRDLKPSNVLLTPNGIPVLIDFNLALDPTADGFRLGGTLPYMPPEQLHAMSGVMRPPAGDVRGDLYALGVIAYELLTGSHPFGPVPARLSKHEARDFLLGRVGDGPRPLRELNPAVDARLESLILRCISADPAERPASADELATEIRRCQARGRNCSRWRAMLVAAAIAVVPTGLGVSAFAPIAPPQAKRAPTGEELYAAGDYQGAVKAFTAVLEADPNQPEAYFRRGRAYQQQAMLAEAVADFRKAHPESNGKVAACLGWCRAALDLPEAAVESFNDAIKSGFAPPEVFADKAYCLSRMGKGKNGEAMQNANMALQRNPSLDTAAAAAHTAAITYFNAAGSGNRIDVTPAIDALRKVREAGRGTMKQHHLAALLCAMAIRQSESNVDPQLDADGLKFTEATVLAGYPLADLVNDPAVDHWAKQLVPGLVGQRQAELPFDGRLVDPLRGELK